MFAPAKSYFVTSNFPRSTLSDAFGNSIKPPCTVFRAGGAFGSGWLLTPSERQTYCSLPKLTIETDPENDLELAPSSNTRCTACGLLWSLLTTITDHSPSGSCTG